MEQPAHPLIKVVFISAPFIEYLNVYWSATCFLLFGPISQIMNVSCSATYSNHSSTLLSNHVIIKGNKPGKQLATFRHAPSKSLSVLLFLSCHEASLGPLLEESQEMDVVFLYGCKLSLRVMKQLAKQQTWMLEHSSHNSNRMKAVASK